MGHFARIDQNNIVQEVIVADQEYIYSLPNKQEWLQTSYNTREGKHPEGKPFRKNYAALGFFYDKNLDAFIPPKPYNSWNLNLDSCVWEAPIPFPSDGYDYDWDEEMQNWKLLI